MQTRNKTGGANSTEDTVAPKSFVPQVSDPLRPSAWDRLENLTRGEARPTTAVEAEQLIALARNTIRARRNRKRVLPAEMFGEPAWDMLLTLFVGSQAGARQTVSNLSMSSGSAATTALRWIDYLERQEFVTRRPSPTDRRITFIDLTEPGRLAVEGYFANLFAEESFNSTGNRQNDLRAAG